MRNLKRLEQRLHLSKETLKRLEAPDLQLAVGGSVNK